MGKAVPAVAAIAAVAAVALVAYVYMFPAESMVIESSTDMSVLTDFGILSAKMHTVNYTSGDESRLYSVQEYVFNESSWVDVAYERVMTKVSDTIVDSETVQIAGMDCELFTTSLSENSTIMYNIILKKDTAMLISGGEPENLAKVTEWFVKTQ